MDDLFDAFETDNGSTVAIKQEQQLPSDNQNQAREISNQLLNRLSAGGKGDKRTLSMEVDESPLAKLSRIIVKNEILQELNEDDDEDSAFSFDKNPRMNIQRIMMEENCTHEVAFPHDMEFVPLAETNAEAAKEYPFKLDSFQLQAVKCIDNNQSVLVSAHTSAGKTAVALYAIAMALRDHQRVIYTSPIKALSNQKYRELSEEFPDVGLVTGDVTLNPNASCVVMTTEILRSMLYRGAEIMREVGWVIFDEIHYMRDKERGVVWEEAIILLPDNVHYVFLSATIPNARQFAEWICYLHHQPCHVVYTDYRPTPLQHFLYSAGSDGLYEVVDVQGRFREDQFAKAMSFLAEKGDQPRMSGPGGSSNIVKIIRTIKEQDMLPCIIFSFSRKECEAYASTMKDMDFNDEDEKKTVKTIYENAMSLLSDEDRKLPQISTIVPFLMRGIGIHHSGLLPILKEVTEILFGEGLIKTLFATETFAMGLNMPAKTVLFTSARKFDGTDNRWISSGEYIQMSGRAGRRGKDDRGLVILMVDQQMGADVAKQIIKGTTDPLNSQFRLTYVANMVLNLLRVPDITPNYMLEKSFYQFQNYSALPSLHKKLTDSKTKMNNYQVENLLEIEGYHQLEKKIESLEQSIKSRILKPKNVVPYFQAGRLLKIKWGVHDFGWTVLVSYTKKPNPLNPLSGELIYVVEVVAKLSKESAKNLNNISQIRPAAVDAKRNGMELIHGSVMEVVPFTFECITAVSTIRLKLPENLKSLEARQHVGKSLQATYARMNNEIPEVDPIEHMKINDEQLKKDMEIIVKLQDRYNNHKIKSRPDFREVYASYETKLALEEEYKHAKLEFKKAKSLLHEEELGCRKRVLRRLQFCDENDQITVKGRVACELSSADELLLTEMIFAGSFSDLKPEACAALLSCFVFEERGSPAKLSDELSGYLRSLQSRARNIAKVVAEAKIAIDEDKYVDSFGPQLMDVVNSWCSGAPFSEIVANTDVFEGSIIRCMRRLELVLNELVNAAKSYGDTSLEEKLGEARKLLKRDIVFSASLYL